MWFYLLIIMLLAILYLLFNINYNISNNKNKKANYKSDTFRNDNVNFSDFYYKKRYLFTKTELFFYYQLKKELQNTDYVIFAKTRLLDIIETKYTIKKLISFNKIKAKHIDFIICKSNGEIVAGIELDDSSHNSYPRKERDLFLNKLFDDIGLKLFRECVSYKYDFNQIKNYLDDINKNT